MEIRVKVFTGAKKEKLEEVSSVAFKCFVKEKPERNLANERVLEILSNYFGIKDKKMRIVSGHRSPNKRIFFENS